MPHISRTRLITVALLGATLISAAGARAGPAETLDPTDPALRQATPAEIQILQFDQNRRNYQQQQQNLREQDRLRVGTPQPRLEVPIMQPRLPVQTFGNSYMR